MKGYTQWTSAQLKFMLPAYLAYVDVHQGKLPGGYDLGINKFKAKYAKVFDVTSTSQLDLYKTGRALVAKGYLSRDQLFQYRGGQLGRIADASLEAMDPISVFILLMTVVGHELQEIQKESAKQ
jgi:hypothetical protein